MDDFLVLEDDDGDLLDMYDNPFLDKREGERKDRVDLMEVGRANFFCEFDKDVVLNFCLWESEG